MATGPELNHAIRAALKVLRTRASWQKEIMDELVVARGQRREAERAVHALIRTEDDPARRRVFRAMAAATLGEFAPGRRAGMTARSRMLLAALKDDPDRDWSVEDLKWVLQLEGFAQRDRYVASTLSEWCSKGIVQRTGRGTYRLNSRWS